MNLRQDEFHTLKKMINTRLTRSENTELEVLIHNTNKISKYN